MSSISLFFVARVYSAGTCPNELGWIQAGDSCYLVSQKPMNWYESQEFCWSEGAYLAEVKSREEEALLDQFLIEGTVYWIGLDDFASEGYKHL